MSLFDGTKFAVMAQLTDGVFLLVFRKKLKPNEQYEKSI